MDPESGETRKRNAPAVNDPWMHHPEYYILDWIDKVQGHIQNANSTSPTVEYQTNIILHLAQQAQDIRDNRSAYSPETRQETINAIINTLVEILEQTDSKLKQNELLT